MYIDVRIFIKCFPRFQGDNIMRLQLYQQKMPIQIKFCYITLMIKNSIHYINNYGVFHNTGPSKL
jgi:hypothetical protein